MINNLVTFYTFCGLFEASQVLRPVTKAVNIIIIFVYKNFTTFTPNPISRDSFYNGSYNNLNIL